MQPSDHGLHLQIDSVLTLRLSLKGEVSVLCSGISHNTTENILEYCITVIHQCTIVDEYNLQEAQYTAITAHHWEPFRLSTHTMKIHIQCK